MLSLSLLDEVEVQEEETGRINSAGIFGVAGYWPPR